MINLFQINARKCLFYLFCVTFSLKLYVIFAIFGVLFHSVSLEEQPVRHTIWENDVFSITFKQLSVLSIVPFREIVLGETKQVNKPCWLF